MYCAGERLIVGDSFGRIVAWDSLNNRKLYQLHEMRANVANIQVSEDISKVVVLSSANELVVFDFMPYETKT